MSWVNGEKGPQCICGMPTRVMVSDDGKLSYILCIFHTNAAGAMFYLPTNGKPEHWPNVTHDEIRELVKAGNAEHNISFEKEDEEEDDG
jgi:hypothetical protein